MGTPLLIPQKRFPNHSPRSSRVRMSQIILRTPEAYARSGCHVKIICDICGHCAVFGAPCIGAYFRERRLSIDLAL
jgi:hypothetical protein